MATELDHQDDVIDEPKDTVATCAVISVPDSFAPVLDVLLIRTRKDVLPRMLHLRECSSSKYYPEVPCVISKSLIAKYQRNKKLVTVRRIVLPICGDKGRQVKLVAGGVLIPALFKREVLPVRFPKPIVGYVRQIEFYKRKGKWLASVCYNTPVHELVDVEGVIGIDRNSVGNVAVLADPQNGKVQHLGFNPAATKHHWRRRRANLKSAGKRRTLRQLSRKQSRRTTHENHIVSKQIVSYAVKHHRAIAVENLETVRKPNSKIRKYVEKSQWAFYQLLSFIRYKAALHGVIVAAVNPAYTSQNCSRCGQRNTLNGKKYVCEYCGHTDHRDANAAFNIAKRGAEFLSMGGTHDSERVSGAVLVTPSLEVPAYA
jgi:putative transposase